jgi:hypothetical protein
LKRTIGFLFILLTFGINCYAKDTLSDSIIYQNEDALLIGDLQPLVITDSVWHPDPKKATMLSAAFPGAGQIYNGQWWKAPIIFAGMGTLGYFISWNNKNYIRYSNAYLDFTDEDPTTKRYEDVIPPGYQITDPSWFSSTLDNRKEAFRRDRDFMVVCLVGVYALNIIEANVAAHLHDFDVSDDLSMSIVPEMNYNAVNRSPTLGLGLTLNINK